MNTSLEQVGFDETTSSDSRALESEVLEQAALMPHLATRLYMQVSLRLTQAQEALHDAIFGLDGTEASFDRYATARSELDSAEAWALRVVKTVPRQYPAPWPCAPLPVL